MGISKITIKDLAMIAATKLSPSANKVLMLFFAKGEYLISMEQSDIQKQLSIKSKTTIVSALKELEDENIIIKLPNPSDMRRNDYSLRPLAADSDERLDLALDEMLKARLSN